MIIFGFSVILVGLVGEGPFYCPNCKSDQFQRTRKRQRFFTLFFIPIIPLKVIDHVVVCQRCVSEYNTEVLEIPTDAEENRARRDAYGIIMAFALQFSVQDRQKLDIATTTFRSLTKNTLTDGYRADSIELTSYLQIPTTQAIEIIRNAAPSFATEQKESLVALAATIATASNEISESVLAPVVTCGEALGLSEKHIKGILLDVIDRRRAP